MTLTEKYRADLLKMVDLYKVCSGKSDGSISAAAFPTDYDFVARLRGGKNITLYKAGKLEDYVESKLEDIRKQLRPGEARLHRTEEIHPLCEAEGEPSAPDRPKASRSFSDDDGAEYWR